jgi:sulfate/thiosulfate-binding protein
MAGRWFFPWALLTACGGTETGTPGEPSAPQSAQTLIIGAYTTPREAFNQDILPKFAEQWAHDHPGSTVTFETSFQGSGAQARAIVGGFEADVAALSLQPDIDVIRKAGLITAASPALPQDGIVTTSVVVLGVRKGNPKGIKDWGDLTRPDVEVLTPNVRTSGGAMWNVAAVYGAALRGKAGVTGDAAGADGLLRDVLARVKVMDKGARESMTTFEQGVGDVIITYENEVLAAQRAGREVDYVVPSSTILIENPVAIVDQHTSRHGTQALAEAFTRFLFTDAAQAALSAHGYRTKTPAAGRPTPADLFTIRDLGGWEQVQTTIFGTGGAYDRASQAAQGGR